MTDSAVNESQTLANGIVHTVLTATISSYGKGKFRPVPRRIETAKIWKIDYVVVVDICSCVKVGESYFSEHPFRLLLTRHVMSTIAKSFATLMSCRAYCIVSCALRASANNESGVKVDKRHNLRIPRWCSG